MRAHSWDEVNLQLMQWNETLQHWMDITTDVNIDCNVVHGETTSLPWFATMMKLPGDADGDVDVFDIVAMAGIYGVTVSDPSYDLNCDGDIDVFDVVAASSHYG